MAKVKLEKIQEACDLLIMKTNISILEEAANNGLSDIDMARSKLIIHENIKYIKDSLIQGGILESAQNLLADNWTEAILEDMSLADMVDNGKQYFAPEDEGMSAGQMAGAAGLAAGAAGAAYGGPQMRNNYNASRAMGVSPLASAAAAGDMFGQKVNQDFRAGKDAVNHAGLKAANIAKDAEFAARQGYQDIKNGAKSVYNNAKSDIMSKVAPRPISGSAVNTAQSQLPAQSTVKKVRRAF